MFDGRIFFVSCNLIGLLIGGIIRCGLIIMWCGLVFNLVGGLCLIVMFFLVIFLEDRRDCVSV